MLLPGACECGGDIGVLQNDRIGCSTCGKLALKDCDKCRGSGVIAFDGDAMDCDACEGYGRIPNQNKDASK